MNFEKSKNHIFSKTAQPILMAKIHVIEGTKEVLKKNREPIPLIIRIEKNIYVKYTTFHREKVGKIFFAG